MKFTKAQQLSLARLRLVVFDVDGVLTDGRLFYGPEGEQLKAFHVRDGVGLKLLVDSGLHVAVVSAKDSPMLARRMTDLGIQNYFPGVKDKRAAVADLAAQLGIPASATAFVGDDMVDLHAMAWCGVGMAPSDAYSYVYERADIQLPVPGGGGVARWVADIILEAQGLYDNAYHTAALPHFERAR